MQEQYISEGYVRPQTLLPLTLNVKSNSRSDISRYPLVTEANELTRNQCLTRFFLRALPCCRGIPVNLSLCVVDTPGTRVVLQR